MIALFPWWTRESKANSAVAQSMPLIVGAPRSGTTLLRLMLDAHPQLAIPPETGFLMAASKLAARAHLGDSRDVRLRLFELVTRFPPDMPGWADYGIVEKDFWAALCRIEPFTVAEGIRTFYRLYAARFGKPRYGDKTPGHARGLVTIQRLLPEAVFIHLIRDGRDVALSWRPQWFSPGNEIETLAGAWRDWVQAARAAAAKCRHYLEIRYEHLVREPQHTLERVCAACDLPFDSAMVDYHARASERLAEHRERRRSDGSLVVSQEQRRTQQRRTLQPLDATRIFAWKREMDADEQQRYHAVAGDLLRELGYEANEQRRMAS